ncbi:Methylmalonyl-CoA mutase [Ekhidna lutea]|uniref:Methylmalonyl-CoA mutase n=1 Tax=Ekhidna lutea TaxID=447679 RepID=A0A239KDT2_EKHLU|nr:methylmalonyl-CoA mutase family protein [Ekhidna lutea]SNT15823.1 Methylmalonyl-CoA mutase [Ekhidna lutea]
MKDLDLNIFPSVSKENWRLLAEKQLKGANPDKELQWINEAGLTVEGYYDSSDLNNLSYLKDYFTSIPSHRWKLYERIEVSNEKEANSQALKALMGGCDGIIFNVQKSIDENILLREINSEICDISFMGSISISQSKIAMTSQNCAEESEVNHSPINQIAELIEKAKDRKFVFRSAFSDFFLEIATVRALKYLLDLNRLSSIHIHTEVPIHKSKEHHWFLNTTAGLASILGGSHSINLQTAIGDSRISRNTGNLIREESGLDMYEDQCGGSYYVEVLTDKIIKEVNERLK